MSNSSQYELLALTGAVQGQVFVIDQGLSIGRSTNCDLFVADRRMSRRHACITKTGHELLIEDLDSHNGTFINGKRIHQARLFRGDVIRVGDVQFEVIHSDGALDTTPVHIVDSGQDIEPTIVKKVDPDNLPEFEPNDSVDLRAGDITADEVLKSPENFQYLMERTQHFVLIYEVSKRLHLHNSASEMCAEVLELVLRLTNAERGFIAWKSETKDSDGEQTYISLAAKLRDGSELDNCKLSTTVADLVLVQGSGVITSNAMADARFSSSDSVVLNDVRSLLAVPMMVGNQAHGLVELESTDLNFEFTESDLDLLSIVGSMLAAAVERIRLAQQRERTIVQLREAQTKLLQAQDQLVKTESMAAIGRFASGIAHEVKNHLAPFMLADMLARNYPDDQDVQESAELMLEAQRRIVGLIDEIRHFASGGSAEYEMLPYDVVNVIEGVIRFVKCDASLKRMDICFESKGRPLVDMDAGRMRQVFINLIRNAADSIGHQQGKIEILVWESEGEATIQFVDNGTGISEQDQKKIFEPFYTTKGDHGLGLGLDISRKIITAHQGTLSFTSGTRGTTFQIVMPLVQGDPNAALPGDSAERQQ